MKYWTKGNYLIDNPYITLGIGRDEPISAGEIVEIEKWGENKFTFGSACNSQFEIWYTKEQAIEALQEAIEWINET